MTGPSERERFIDGLRGLASVLEEHPEVPLPYHGTGTEITFHFLHDEDPRAAMVAAARALPSSTWRKEVRDGDVAYFDMYGSVAGLKVHLVAFREAVCRRVVKGTHEVTEEVPDPEAPKIKQTKVVEDVDWICEPVLPSLPEPPEGVSR